MSTPDSNAGREYYRIKDTMALDFNLLTGPAVLLHRPAQPASRPATG